MRVSIGRHRGQSWVQCIRRIWLQHNHGIRTLLVISVASTSNTACNTVDEFLGRTDTFDVDTWSPISQLERRRKQTDPRGIDIPQDFGIESEAQD